MKRFTTIICCLAFMIAGVAMAIQKNDPSNSRYYGYKTMSAANLPQVRPELLNGMQLPLDLQLDQAKRNSAPDTVYITKTDTVPKQVTKVKWKKVPVPYPVVQRDTVQVPVYYIATQVGNKEGPMDKCIQVYELQKVDEICP